MLKMKFIWQRFCQQTAIVMLTCLVCLLSMPIAAVQAAGYYVEKTHHLETSRPYYSTKVHPRNRTENFLPYYSNQDRRKEKNYLTPSSGDDYIESGKRAGEVIPKELGTGIRQKNPVNMLKRAGEELGNDQIPRAFGAKDYERSEIEQELARNKAARGDRN
jgi:hypothetical protein